MSSASSKKIVWFAVAANSSIAVTKFLAAFATGSSAMFSEAIHSVVDTGNQCLLLLGMSQSQKPPDESHPFGYGKEVYFWTLIVAVVLFSMGGGVALYEGISHLIHPRAMGDPTWAYVVLAAGMVFEGISWFIAVKEVRSRAKGRTMWQQVRASKDMSVITVLLEDTAALLGLTIAFLGIFFGHMLNNPYLDGCASVAIGVMLSFVALVLVRESKGLLVGESADPATVASIRDLVVDDPFVVDVKSVLTMHFGPNEVLLNVELLFEDGISEDDSVRAVIRLERAILERHPDMKRIFIEAVPPHILPATPTESGK
ncbi:cation diffusion facilitator family transporter [Thermodesulfobacteriota bacterium]